MTMQRTCISTEHTPTLPPLPHITAAITKPQKSLVQRLRTTRWQLLIKHPSSQSKFTFL